MDSPIVAQLFRQLFHHRPAGCQARVHQLRHGVSAAAASRHRHSYQQTCSYATRASRDRGMKSNESRWQQRTNLLPEDRRDEFAQYPYISMSELKRRKERPRKVKMLLRDFIDGMFYTFNSQTCMFAAFLFFQYADIFRLQTAYTTPHTATFPNKPSSSPPVSPSTSPLSATTSPSNPNSVAATHHSKTTSTILKVKTQPASYGTPQPSSSAPTTAKPSRGTSSPTTASRPTPTTTYSSTKWAPAAALSCSTSSTTSAK